MSALPALHVAPVAPRCPLCAGVAAHQATMPIDAKTYRPTAHGAIYRCPGCALGFVHPRPTPQETAAFYALDAYYTQGATHMAAAPSPALGERLRTHLAWRADRSRTLQGVIAAAFAGRSADIVDIGCGSGALLKALHGRGHRVTGVERDASALARRDAGIRVLEGSAEALPAALAPGSMDGVVFSHVLEHLVDPLAAVRQAAALLKPGGLLFCEVPNNESLVARQSGLAWEHLDVPRHVNFFTQASLTGLAQRAGLQVRDVYFGGYCRYFGGSYIATEARIYDHLAALPGGAHDATRNSAARAWGLLARTAFAPARLKYDSVGLVAAAPGAR